MCPATEIGTNQNRISSPKKSSRKKERSTRQSPKPKLAIEYEGIDYPMAKDPDHKGRLKPMPRGPDSVDEYDLEVFHMDDSKHKQKPVREANGSGLREAFRAFCQFGQLSDQSSIVWKLVLMALLARVLDLFQGSLTGGVPAIILTGIQSVPPVVALLLHLVNGDPQRRKGCWSLHYPSVIQIVRPLGSSAPSDDPYAYFGGDLKLNYYRKNSFWLPPQNMAVAIALNCPDKIRDIIIKEWAVSIPILCGSSTKRQPVISLDGKPLLASDPEIEQSLRQWSELIYSELWCFFQWFRQKRHRWAKCLDQASQYRPVEEIGKRIYMAEDHESVILSLALSLFCFLLRYALKAGWVTEEDAQQVFSEVWYAVLPESAKKANKKAQDREVITTAGFYDFLGGYLGQNLSQIVPKDGRCTNGSIAALRNICNKDLLILPRSLTLQALCREHPGLEVDTTQGNWETTLQRTLMDAGISLRTEGKDISWRYSFYPAGHAPKGVQPKLPCLGIPVDELSDDVLTLLQNAFGNGSGEGNEDNGPEPVAEKESAGDKT